MEPATIIALVSALAGLAGGGSKQTIQQAAPLGGTAPNPNGGMPMPQPTQSVGEVLSAIPDDPQTVPQGKPPGSEPEKKGTKTSDMLGALADALSIPGVSELLGLTAPDQRTVVLPVPGGPATPGVVPGMNLPQRPRVGDIINSIPRLPNG